MLERTHLLTIICRHRILIEFLLGIIELHTHPQAYQRRKVKLLYTLNGLLF